MSTPLLDLNKCTIRFGGLTAVSAVDMQIGPHDLLGLIGPNGAGKTTVFNIITGVYQPTSGTITFNNKPIAGLKPNVIAKRGIARTFQNIRLFPTLSVYDNVRAAFNLRLHHRLAHASCAVSLVLSRGKTRSAAQVMEMLEIFGLALTRSICFAAVFPTAISAGSKSCAPSRRSRSSCCSTSRRRG